MAYSQNTEIDNLLVRAISYTPSPLESVYVAFRYSDTLVDCRKTHPLRSEPIRRRKALCPHQERIALWPRRQSCFACQRTAPALLISCTGGSGV